MEIKIVETDQRLSDILDNLLTRHGFKAYGKDKGKIFSLTYTIDGDYAREVIIKNFSEMHLIIDQGARKKRYVETILQGLKLKLKKFKARQLPHIHETLIIGYLANNPKFAIITPVNMYYKSWNRVERPVYILVSENYNEIKALRNLFDKIFNLAKVIRI